MVKKNRNKLIDTLGLLWTTENGPQFLTSLFKDYCEIIRLMEVHTVALYTYVTASWKGKGEIRTGNQKCKLTWWSKFGESQNSEKKYSSGIVSDENVSSKQLSCENVLWVKIQMEGQRIPKVFLVALVPILRLLRRQGLLDRKDYSQN